MKALSRAAELWPRIIAHQAEWAVHPFLPLHNLGGADAVIGLTSLRADIFPPLISARVPVVGKLAELTAGDLVELRKALYIGLESASVRLLAEKLLRNVEIKFPNTSGLHPALRQPKFAAAMLAAFFLDFWTKSGDGRFLNASWKLLDYQTARWRGCGSGPGLSPVAAQALLCRNILLAEQGLRKI